MQRSTDRIYTTHVGSLARPAGLLDLMKAAAGGQQIERAAVTEREHPAPRPDHHDRNVRPRQLHDEATTAT
jgi:hypothetical protein